MAERDFHKYIAIEELPHKGGFRNDRLYLAPQEKLGKEGVVMVNEFYLQPHSRIRSHKHTGMAETIGVLDGEAVVLIRDKGGEVEQEIKLLRGESFAIPAQKMHSIINPSQKETALFALGIPMQEGGQTVEFLEKFLATKDVISGEPIDILRKDGDPRKTAFFVGMLSRHKGLFRLWKEFGLLEKMQIQREDVAYKDQVAGFSVRQIHRGEFTGWERRKPNVTEHMITVAAGAQALAQMAVETGHLINRDVDLSEQAALAHDLDKLLEVKITGDSTNVDYTTESFLDSIKGKIRSYGINNLTKFGSLIANYKRRTENVDFGVRAVVAFDLAASVGRRCLIEKGIDLDVADIQRMVAFNTCPQIEELINGFDQLESEERKKAILIFIMHYMDDIVVNPNIIDTTITMSSEGERLNALDRRMQQNDTNPRYDNFNYGWKEIYGETAFQTQRRVGHMVEAKLAKLLGVDDSLTLPSAIDAKIQKNIQENWDRLYS